MFKLLSAAALFAAVCTPKTAQASDYLRQSTVRVAGFGCVQQCSDVTIEQALHFTYGEVGDFIYHDPSPTLTTLNHTSHYSGLDESGNYSTMTFAASGRADVGAGALKSAISGSITNPFFSQ